MAYAYICCFALVTLNLLGSSEAKQAAARVDELYETESQGAEGSAGHEATTFQIDANGNVNKIKETDFNSKELDWSSNLLPPKNTNVKVFGTVPSDWYNCIVNMETIIRLDFSKLDETSLKRIKDFKTLQGLYQQDFASGSTAEFRVFKQISGLGTFNGDLSADNKISLDGTGRYTNAAVAHGSNFVHGSGSGRTLHIPISSRTDAISATVYCPKGKQYYGNKKIPAPILWEGKQVGAICTPRQGEECKFFSQEAY